MTAVLFRPKAAGCLHANFQILISPAVRKKWFGKQNGTSSDRKQHF